MKRLTMALAVIAAAALAGCGGKSEAGSGSSSGSTGQATGTTTGAAGSTGTSSSGSTGGTTSSSTTTGGSSGSTGASGSTGTTGFQVANHEAFPQVPNNTNSPTLHHLQLITITFNGYSHQTDVEAFGDWIVSSDWLTTVGADYDVHAGTHVAKVHLTDTAPTTITDDQIQTYLQGKIADGTLPAPGSTITGSSDTLTEPLYTIFYPSTTSITMGSGSQQATSCNAFGGYHNYFTYTPTSGAATKVSYAVLPTCGAGWSGSTEMDQITIADSHELIEAATDPFPYTGIGNDTTSSYAIQNYDSPWAFIPGEVGDLCIEQNLHDTASGYVVQRVWSNSAAAATPGQSPCIPAPDAAYYNVTTDVGTTQALIAGTSVTYHVTAWSDRAVGGNTGGKWYVTVYPYQANFSPKYTLTTSDGQTITDADQNGYVSMGNGDTATFTVTVPAGTQGGSFASIMLGSSLNGYSFNFWPTAIYVN